MRPMKYTHAQPNIHHHSSTSHLYSLRDCHDRQMNGKQVILCTLSERAQCERIFRFMKCTKSLYRSSSCLIASPLCESNRTSSAKSNNFRACLNRHRRMEKKSFFFNLKTNKLFRQFELNKHHRLMLLAALCLRRTQNYCLYQRLSNYYIYERSRKKH